MRRANVMKTCYDLTIDLSVTERESMLKDYFRRAVKSEGLKEATLVGLYKALKDTNFCFYPASTKYHSHYIGGLFDHCKCVTEILKTFTSKGITVPWSRPCSPYIIGFLHDIDKTQKYFITKEKSFVYDPDYCPISTNHGLSCAFKASEMVNLTEEEFYCIRFHMGAFEDKDRKAYSNAIENYPNVLFVHTADMIASQILEERMYE